MNSILPDTDTPIKTLPSDRFDNAPDRLSQSPSGGSIVIRMGLDGIQTVQIIANQSDEADQLNERLTAARPLLELLKNVVMAG